MKGLSILMRRYGDTLVQLSKYLGVASHSVWRWKAGKRMPPIEIQRQICERYGCTLDELLNGPAKNELKIEFVWEVEDMDVANIESNKFNYGFRGNDVLLWGALSDDEDDETVAHKILKHIRAARIGKRATNEALEKMEG